LPKNVTNACCRLSDAEPIATVACTDYCFYGTIEAWTLNGWRRFLGRDYHQILGTLHSGYWRDCHERVVLGWGRQGWMVGGLDHELFAADPTLEELFPEKEANCTNNGQPTPEELHNCSIVRV
jgi:hypothetical protein